MGTAITVEFRAFPDNGHGEAAIKIREMSPIIQRNVAPRRLKMLHRYVCLFTLP